MITPEEACVALEKAECLYPQDVIDAAIDRIAQAITDRWAACNPLVLVVMNGGLIPAAHMLNRLHFPVRIGYLHATRYRGTQGGAIDWQAAPSPAIIGQSILVIDDIFDEGHTLKAIVERLRNEGAQSVHAVVLFDKQHDRKVQGFTVDVAGLTVPDRYVFGCGMDYHGYWRQLPALYALAQ